MEARLPRVAWPTVRLSDVAHVQTGVAKGAKILRDRVRVPYLRVANVQAGSLNLLEVKTIEVDRTAISRYSLRAGDVLMTEGGDFDKLGRGAIWTGEINPCLHQNHLFAVRCDPSRLLPEWLSWVSASHYGRRYFMLCAKQSTNLASINSTQLKAFPLPLPPIARQQQIAQIVRAAESRLAVISRLLDAKIRFKRGLTQQLLTGQRRFPEFQSSPWIKTTIGEVFQEATRPVQWREDSIYTLVSVRRRSGGVFLRERKKGSDIRVKALSELRRGDILISTRQIVHGATALVPIHFDGAHVSGEYMVLVPKLGAVILPEYFDHLSRLPRMYHAAFLASYGVAIEKLTFNSEWYLDSVIHLPPTVEEQRRIADILGIVDHEIDLLVAQRAKVSAYKSGVLSRVLSGDIAIPA